MAADDASSRDVFGRIVSAPMIERGAEVCLRYWIGHYIGEVLVQAGHGRDDLPDPTDLQRAANVDWPTDGQIALVVVASQGTSGEAVANAQDYTAVWDLTIGVVTSLGFRLETREAAQFYAAAVGVAIEQQGIAVADPATKFTTWLLDDEGEPITLAGANVTWLGEDTSVMAERDGGALMSGTARFAVTVEQARPRGGGPTTLPNAPGSTEETRTPSQPGEPSPVDPTLTIERDPVEDFEL